MVGWASGNCQDHRAQIFRALERASNRGWRQGRVDDIGRDGAVHALGACEHNVRWSSTGAFILVILVIWLFWLFWLFWLSYAHGQLD